MNKIVIFHLPFGGSITLGHHVPLIYLSFKCGWKTGAFASMVYSMLSLIFSFKIPPAKNFFSFIFIIFLDYVLPYIFIGLCSFFKFKKVKNKFFKIYGGVIISFALNLFSCIVSGVVLWKDYIPFDINIWIYSIIYNSLHIIPQLIITIILLRNILKSTCFTTFL